jgi:hypothetical protein
MTAGDFDGDGIDDLVTLAPGGWGELNLNRGEVHGFWGRKNWKPFYFSQTDDFDFASTATVATALQWVISTATVAGIWFSARFVERATRSWNPGVYRIVFGGHEANGRNGLTSMMRLTF